jgi:hypothetical protein
MARRQQFIRVVDRLGVHGYKRTIAAAGPILQKFCGLFTPDRAGFSPKESVLNRGIPSFLQSTDLTGKAARGKMTTSNT